MAAFALVLLLLACAAEAQSRTVQQIQARGEAARDSATRDSAARDSADRQTSLRVARRTHLTENEREIITKQIMQAISEMVSSDCMLDHDYRGWLDFGRRDAE
ncbi:gastrin/cholecystokinin-like peptide [Entelurus aequoreus]|uniref:gastrin/cholecystokinin-like peptide n=1 Tax=Entelurus aequoreus TaxID=161455 RepID=UPI002B1D0189|nr:gastrin/cholecystokinin-like peptide [Entelurus aequoreus]